LGVGVQAAFDHHVDPGSEFLLAAGPDLDPGRGDRLGRAGEGQAEDVLKRFQPVAPPGQQGADRGVGEVGQLDLHRGAAGGEGPLDAVQVGRTGQAAEAEPGDLVERRAGLGEARHAAGQRDHEACRVGPAAACRVAGLGDQLRLGLLDAPGQGGVAEQRQPAGHARSRDRCPLRRQQAPPAVLPRVDVGVPAVHGQLLCPQADDHRRPPGHHRGRGAKAD
jgi:hypothetical protein